jgi:hypothetical protein
LNFDSSGSTSTDGSGTPPTGTYENSTSSIEPPVATGVTIVPPPGATISVNISIMAGGSQPSSYGWAPKLSDEATTLLQVINFVDNALLDILINGHDDLTTGRWSRQYPATIQNTIGSMGAQAIVHRSTATDSLTHYSKPIISPCKYNYELNNVNDFIDIALSLLLLEIGLLLDVIGQVALTDTWIVAPLASTLGSKARMSGMVNMMQNHIAAAAPREVAIPWSLVYSYVSTHYVASGSCPDKISNAPPVLPSYNITPGETSNGRLMNVKLKYDISIKGTLSMVWLGPWGALDSTTITVDANVPGTGTANVPADLSGHVWGVLANGVPKTSSDLKTMAVTGPEMVWVTQP